MRALLEKPLHLGAIVALVLALAEMSGLHALSGPENRLTDALVRVQSRGLAPDPDIVIVDIDESSLAQSGRNPEVTSRLVSRMKEVMLRGLDKDDELEADRNRNGNEESLTNDLR